MFVDVLDISKFYVLPWLDNTGFLKAELGITSWDSKPETTCSPA